MLNLSPLFNTADGNQLGFVDKLELEEAERNYIAAAKLEVRNCLKLGIPRVLKSQGFEGEVPDPRFFTQGSWAYKTLNAPAQNPQQADVDDGAYMPLSFVAQTSRPSVASSIFFAAAEAALAPLITAKSWQLVTDKPTCIRIVIGPRAHIDVPLYAIPDKEFVTLAKAAFDHGHKGLMEAMRAKAEKDAWTALPRNSVLLAHREDNWIASDPRPVKEWFVNEVTAKGEQLRRVVRYLKAFRDWKWSSGGPSSILLMAAATPHFEKRDRRDDLALLEVVAKIPETLRKGVVNPVDKKESLTDRLGAEKVEEAAKSFEEFEKFLRGAVNAGSASQACVWMVGQFGPRFPNEPSRIVVTSAAATVAAAPATYGPSEIVGRSQAG
jgi:hypothetical protein